MCVAFNCDLTTCLKKISTNGNTCDELEKVTYAHCVLNILQRCFLAQRNGWGFFLSLSLFYHYCIEL